MKKPLKLLLCVLVLVMSVLLIMVFSSGGCRPAAPAEEEKPESEEALGLSEKPDEELFDKYFSSVSLHTHFGLRNYASTFGGDVEENVCTLLPHQEGWLTVGFKNKKNFIFRIAVLNLETNDFVERCATTASSYGSDGFGMEALEWAFLRHGSYEYRIYVEDTLVAALPFEVMSYFKMSPAYILGFLLDIVLNPLVWALIIFWSIYAKTKKRWAKITAIVFSCIAPLAIFVSCFGNCIVTEILLGYWF
ncbi:MAG: hypothetical protein L6305_07535 [Actinomycetia bacterium]|nr:hypothetical protein [Actinomycetes bacterium]